MRRTVRAIRLFALMFFFEIVQVVNAPMPSNHQIISTVCKYTGIRYLTDVVLGLLAFKPTWFFGFAETVTWWYNTHQTHRPVCPECRWYITPWPFNGSHKYCDEELALDHDGIAGPHSIAVSYCECGSPLTKRIIRRKTHACEYHMENLDLLRNSGPFRLRYLRSLIGIR